jgi:hypothetical protein
MANTTNYNWETPDDTDLVKDGAAAIRTLGNSIDTTTKNLNPETTTGDIAYRSATANTNTRLAIGSTGQVLTVAAGVPSWATPTVGDITEVQAGTGISVASGTGPIPVITNTVATAFDAAGDLVYGTGADTFSKLAIGTAGQVLQVNSGATAPEWGSVSAASFTGAKATSSDATQSIANNTNTTVNWNAEEYDTSSIHNTVTNNSRLTIPAGLGGYWSVTSKITFAGNNTGARQLRLNKNGALVANFLVPITGSGEQSIILTNTLNLAAADYLEIVVYQNSGGALNLNLSGAEGSYFLCEYLGA